MRKPTITAALLAAVVAPFFVYNAVCQTTRTAADSKDHTANIGVLASIVFFKRCSSDSHDSAIVREAYHGFVDRLGGVKPVEPAEEPPTLDAKDCHDLAIEINRMVSWHSREDTRPASQE